MKNAPLRRGFHAVAVLVACSLTACGGGGWGGRDTGSSDPSTVLDPRTKVTITIDCMPPATRKAEVKEWNEDVAEFNKTYPNVTVEGRSTPGQCLEPARFTAMLKAKSQPDVFFTYFTDLPQVLAENGAEDISAYVTPWTVPLLQDINPDVLDSLRHRGRLYGLPTSNYTMGLLINRKLFEDAGLDPDDPPRTWEEVRAAAKRIAALGDDVAGFGEYSAGNTGGWHFTAQLYSLGGDVVDSTGSEAAFNTDLGRRVAENLHAMRWEDDSMGSTQLLKWGDPQKRLAGDKLGMFLAAPDDITYMVQQLGARYENFGMGPIPGGEHTLAGGNTYMVKQGISPDKIKAAIAWLNFKNLTVGKGQFDWSRTRADGLPVGIPQPNLWLNGSKTEDDATRLANATMPVANFRTFMDNPVPGKAEPPMAQEVYRILDDVMSGILTDEDADIDKLLSTAETRVNEVLADR
ncbi:ABC transporter substrate-binding protein [Streptomyces sp. NPDC007818]|uniref:ABC transporter substrate-binding protein n=1 Tax=Streptomyces sp. NPDC007818 TaxID=3364780 RepID=UPI00369B3C04